MNVHKIERDPYYYPLYNQYGLPYILDSGFFFDEVESIDLEESMKILCTPTDHIKKPITEKHCVILTTGAMDPVHQGHLDMMNCASEELVRQGYEVLGGYISPAHDSYVSKKNKVSNKIHIRNALISEICEDTNFALDPWAGTFLSGDVNFTVIIERIKMYLMKYIGLDTEIIYVCGSDNWKFSRTFTEKGKCVVVTRPGYLKISERPRNSYLAMGNNAMSSTLIRNAEISNSSVSSMVKNLVLRDDNTPLLTDVFEKYFSNVEIVRVEDQRNEFLKLDLHHVISLDSVIFGDWYFRTSRLFSIFGHIRIGWVDGDHKLPSYSDVLLYDDDIHTGDTMNHTKNILQDIGYNVCSQLSFNSFGNCEKLDNRDFIAFGNNSGLMIQLEGNHYRVPYIYPFVDPSVRCSVNDPLQFSIDMWQANLIIFGDCLLIDYPQYDFYCLLGFDEKSLVSDICKFYLNLLTSLTNN